jgi:hypothetical protein
MKPTKVPVGPVKQEKHQLDMQNAEAQSAKLETQLQELEECLQATHEEAVKDLEVGFPFWLSPLHTLFPFSHH